MSDERDDPPSSVEIMEGPAPERPAEFLPERGWKFITILAAIVTLITGGLTLAQFDLLFVVGGTIASAAIFELYWIYSLRQEVSALREKTRILKARLEETGDDGETLTISKRLADSILTYLDYDDPEYAHTWCFVRERVQEFDISGTDGTMTIRISGNNQSDEDIESYYTTVTAESSLYGFEDRFSASQDGQDLHTEVVASDRNSRVVRIYFRRPVPQGEEFEFEYVTRFRNEFEDPESYVFYPVGIHEGGIGRLLGRLILDESPYNVRLSHITGVREGNEISVNQQADIIDETPTDDDRVQLEFERRNPTGVYILEFTRRDLS
jgi:hypothetical protein